MRGCDAGCVGVAHYNHVLYKQHPLTYPNRLYVNQQEIPQGSFSLADHSLSWANAGDGGLLYFTEDGKQAAGSLSYVCSCVYMYVIACCHVRV